MLLPERFFFYGTLSEGMDNPVVAAIRPKLGPARPATVTGRLYAIPERDGWYPALLRGDRRVAGFVYEVMTDFGANDLAMLDRYEAFDPDRPHAGEYARAPIAATLGDAQVMAEVYRYNAPLPATARPIAEPGFAAFLAAHGLRPLAPRD